MKRILIYLLKTTKKYALIFNENKNILDLKDLTDLTKDEIILNGLIKDSDKFLEKWEMKSAQIKKIEKTKSSFKITIDAEFKLLLRKTE